MLRSLENKFVFQPKKLSFKKADILLSKQIQKNKNIINLKINTKDNHTLDALYYHNTNTDKLILYCHGNAGNIYNRFEFINKYKHISSILIFDYRGYGISSGSPDENGLYIDIYSVWKYVLNSLNFEPKNIILYGNSLGCSVALWLGMFLSKSQLPTPAKIIIDSPFYSLKYLVSDIFPLYAKYMLYSQFNNIKYIKNTNNQIKFLIIHSNQDKLINIKHSYKIIKNSKLNKTNLLVIKGGHNTPIINDDIFNKIINFIIN